MPRAWRESPAAVPLVAETRLDRPLRSIGGPGHPPGGRGDPIRHAIRFCRHSSAPRGGRRPFLEARRGDDHATPEAELPAADDGEFYVADLIGLAAVSPAGEVIGEVVAVQNYGAGDLLEIRLAGAASTELVVFNDTFVPSVDIAEGRVVVAMPVVQPDDDPSPPTDETD